MGTNYYAHMSVYGHEIELHIGKYSGGWKFLFGEYDNLQSKKDWFAFLAREWVSIFDEYGRLLALDDFISEVESAQQPGRLDYLNASTLQWGADVPARSKYERLDADGYRFSTSNPEDWS